MLPSRIPAFQPSTTPYTDQAESSNRQLQSPSARGVRQIAQHLQTHPQHAQALQQTWQPNIRPALPGTPLTERLQALQTTLVDWINSLTPAEQAAGQAIKKILLNKKPHQKSLLIAFKTSSLPDFFPYFKDLESLEIECRAKTLFASIDQLSKLKTLTITAPELVELPSTFGHLKSLNSLCLRWCNNLVGLPSSVAHLEKLTTLWINSTLRANILPDNTHLIPKLTNLSINGQYENSNTNDDTLNLKQLEHHTTLRKLSLYKIPIRSQDLLRTLELANLRNLEISSSNVLTNIPKEFIATHPKLTRLSINYCENLESLPSNINFLKQLETLDLPNNSALRFIPETISQLRKLKTLELIGCGALRELPRSVSSLPSRCRINLQATGLSLNILEPLSRLVNGPQINYSLPPASLTNIGTLEEEAQKWFDNAKPARCLSPTELEHIAQLDPDSRLPMATLLARFKKTALYQHQRQPTTERICHLLTKILNNPSLLGIFCDMAYESNRTCDDRTALGLIEMELAVLENDLINTTATLSPPQAHNHVVNMGLRVFKQRKLMNIAHEHAKQCKGAVDETEIVLKYLTQLGQKLGVPAALNHMLYEQHAWQVTARDIAAAQASIESMAQKTSPEFAAFLQTWHPFHAVLKQHSPRLLDRIETKCGEIDETLLAKIQETQATIHRLKEAHTEHLRNSLDPNLSNLEEEIKTRVENNLDVLNATIELHQITQQRQEEHANAWKPVIQKAIELIANKRPANTASTEGPESSKKHRVDGPH